MCSDVVGLLHRCMLTHVLAMSHYCLCCCVKSSAQCCLRRQLAEAETDYGLAGCGCNSSAQPATKRIKPGIKPSAHSVLLLLLSLIESRVNLPGAESLWHYTMVYLNNTSAPTTQF